MPKSLQRTRAARRRRRPGGVACDGASALYAAGIQLRTRATNRQWCPRADEQLTEAVLLLPLPASISIAKAITLVAHCEQP
jgi:hypothetical protein